MKTCIVDFESKRMKDGTGVIFSISFMPVTFDTHRGWRSQGRGHDPVYETSTSFRTETVETVFIEDTMADPCIGEDPDIVKKVGRTVIDAANIGGTVKSMPFREAVEYFLGQLEGSTWLGHSIDRDIQFLVETDQRLGTKIFKKDPMAYPETCCSFGNWPAVAKVCTQQLLTRRCPKFMEKYIKAGGATSRLVDLVMYVKGTQQHHTSVQDVLDLAAVIQRAYEEDHFQLEPGKSYMTCIPLQTSALLNQ
jgi:hypothetical protein